MIYCVEPCRDLFGVTLQKEGIHLCPAIETQLINRIRGRITKKKKKKKSIFLSFNYIYSEYIRLEEPMKNQTKMVGKNVKLKCTVTGYPRLEYTWYKDGKVVDAPAKTTKWGSRSVQFLQGVTLGSNIGKTHRLS